MTSDPHPLGKLPLEVVVSVGKARSRLADLLNLSENGTFVLDRTVDDPVDLLVGGQLVARGVLEEQEGDESDTISVRITEVMKSSKASE